jgi:endonuclease YncB( thermonuclease family)
MVIHRVVGIVLVGLTCLVLGAQAPAATPRTLVATVERVTDGDSVGTVTENGTKLRLRLLGIDAPELPYNGKPGQPYAEDARDYLDHLIGGKTIRVDAYGRDQHHRVLAVLWDEQVNVNLLLVAMGYAEVFRGVPCLVYREDLYAAEAKARQDRVGMWAQGPTHESPTDFRRRMRVSGE